MKSPIFLGTALAALLVVFSGCGGSSGPPRIPGHGKVTVDGQPAPAGYVTVRPAANVSGVGGSANIVNGEYRFDDENGPEPGKKYEIVVNLHALLPQAANSPKGGGEAPVATNIKLPGGRYQWSFPLETPTEGEFTHDIDIK